MGIDQILNTTGHRPWSLPNDQWRYYQEWNNAIFLHWQVDISELQKLIPKELEVDLFEGMPWVSLVAFRMENIRLRYLPPFPPISDFEEINIRTYVKYKGKAGVYFLSIEGGKKVSCMLAKGISELPYRYSKIGRQGSRFQSINKTLNHSLSFEFHIGDTIKKKLEIDKWLTERYALFQDAKSTLNAFDIHHLEWPITDLEVQDLYLNYPLFDKLINNKPDRTQYSKGVQVIAWGKQKSK